MQSGGRSINRRKILAVATVMCASLLVAMVRADVVRLVPGATVKAIGGQIQGQITSETPIEVKIKSATGEQAVPVNQIESVSYDGATPSYTLAESRVNAGMLSEAADLYQKAIGEAQGKPLLERAAQFGRAQALAELALADPSKAADAIAALEPLAKAGANGRQLGPALLLLIRLQLAQGNFNRAEELLGEVATRVPWASERVAVLRARVLTEKGEYDGALSALDGLIAGAAKGSVQAREAMLAKAESLAAMKKYSEAESLVREVIGVAPAEDVETQAVAYNTLGNCLRRAGRPKDALLAYLRTDILYSSAKGEHAKALAQIVDLWRELKQDARAAEVFDRLKQLYPQSPYLKAKPGTGG